MSIALIASDADLKEFDITQSDVKKLMDLEIAYGHLSQSVVVAKRLEEKGIEVIIARGATASYLKAANLKTPIVELPITVTDLTSALYEAKELSGKENPRIAAILFRRKYLEAQFLAPLLGLDLKCYNLPAGEMADHVVNQALAEGADVILGGAFLFDRVKRQGIPICILKTGRESLLQGVREARAIASARFFEKQRAEELNAVLNYARGGILAANQEGVITVFNAEAEKITGISRGDILGQKFNEEYSQLNIDLVLRKGEQIRGEIISMGRAKIMINLIPIKVNDLITGLVGTFHDVSQIERMEEKIRRETYSRGHKAKATFYDIVGESRAIRETKLKAEEYARTHASVLIIGETGVGKELFAQSIHRASPIKNGPFVAINCAALPENLLESELFGYVEGAFTGAHRKGKKGLFELAHEGTIFLDEVSELPLSLQVKLLRVLQENEVMRLGHDRVIPINIRVLSGCNKNLKELVLRGEFRNDLYWRLNVLNLVIPPLRDRKEDIPILLRHFLKQLKSSGEFDKDTLAMLVNYQWPGNVRELANFCERLSTKRFFEETLDKSKMIDLLDPFPGQLRTPVTIDSPANEQDIIDEEIKEVLNRVGGNKSLAAKELGIHRVTLWRRIKKANSEGAS